MEGAESLQRLLEKRLSLNADLNRDEFKRRALVLGATLVDEADVRLCIVEQNTPLHNEMQWMLNQPRNGFRDALIRMREVVDDIDDVHEDLKYVFGKDFSKELIERLASGLSCLMIYVYETRKPDWVNALECSGLERALDDKSHSIRVDANFRCFHADIATICQWSEFAANDTRPTDKDVAQARLASDGNAGLPCGVDEVSDTMPHCSPNGRGKSSSATTQRGSNLKPARQPNDDDAPAALLTKSAPRAATLGQTKRPRDTVPDDDDSDVAFHDALQRVTAAADRTAAFEAKSGRLDKLRDLFTRLPEVTRKAEQAIKKLSTVTSRAVSPTPPPPELVRALEIVKHQHAALEAEAKVVAGIAEALRGFDS